MKIPLVKGGFQKHTSSTCDVGHDLRVVPCHGFKMIRRKAIYYEKE